MRDQLEQLWNQGYTDRESLKAEAARVFEDDLTDYELDLFVRRFIRDKGLGYKSVGKAYGEVGRF